MSQTRSKFSLKYLFFLILCSGVSCFLTLSTHAQDRGRTASGDTVQIKQAIDTTIKKKPTVDTLKVRLSKDSISSLIEHTAEDSMVMDVDTRKILLYGKTELKYDDLLLNAPKIEFDQQTQMVTAKMGRDTAGNVAGMAKMKQTESVTVSDSIQFNLKSQKGLTFNSYFQQEDFFNFAQKVKKVNVETIYAQNGRFTTCNLDTPHFAFRFKKAKFVTKKLVVTGPVSPEFEDVPVPLYLPFGIFPMKKGRQSGLLPPQFTVNQDFGLGLEGLGYYRAISDYLDARVVFDVYSYGTWRGNFQPTYRKRYRYSGNFNLSYQNTKFAFKGDPDFNQSKSFFITWSHSMDSKALPGVSFNANVNAGSSKFLALVPRGGLTTPGFQGQSGGSGNYLQPLNFTNQLSSSISYQKNWIGSPFNLSVNLNHNQNTTSKLINLNLPDVAFTMNTIYPLQQKEASGSPKWYQKLGVGYNGNYKGQISFYDTAFQFKQLIDTFQWGASHTVPISLSLPSLGPFQISPNFSFNERTYAQKFNRSWNPLLEKVDTSIEKGVYSAREVFFGLSFSTAFFGTFQSKNINSKVQVIRHVMRPQFSMNYKPDLMKPYYALTQVGKDGYKIPLSVYDGSIFGPFSRGQNGGFSFGLDNNIEMKVRVKIDTTVKKDENSTETDFKKVKLIDGFGISGSYNMLADSLKLSKFSLYMRSTLFDKFNITASGILDPYKKNPTTGRDINEFVWKGGKFNPGSIASGSLNISTNIKSKEKKKDGEGEDKKNEDEFDEMTNDEVQAQLDYVRRNPAEFTDFNVPWTLNFSYSMSFSKLLQPDYTYKTQFTSSLNFNGDFSLTPKWKLGANGFYDLKDFKLQSFTTFITRDLHCWQLSINVTPVGLYKSFNITISPKSGILQDLKINRTRYFYTNN